MIGYVGNIEKETLENNYFRKVLYTGKYGQLVVMSIPVGEEIGMEVHKDTDQFFRIDSGEGKIIIDGEDERIEDGYAVIVPAGVNHNVINTSSSSPLKLYTIYMPPHHKDKTLHKTKVEAEEAEKNH